MPYVETVDRQLYPLASELHLPDECDFTVKMGVSGQHHAPAALLLSGKGPPVPIVQEAGWAPEPVWTQRIEEKSFAPAGNRTPITRSSSPYSDTILPELTRLP
jgi:hypothetical protein